MSSLTFGARLLRNTAEGLSGPFRLALAHRSLLALLVKRDAVARTSGTLLGGVWMLAQPALQMVALWFLLDFVLRVRFPGQVAFVSYFLIGMIPWLMISEVMLRDLSVLYEFSALYQRTAFPLQILPVLPLLMSGSIYGVVYVSTVLLLEGPGAALWALLIVLGLTVWLLPLCYLLSVVGLFMKDTRQLFPFALTMVMYLTPILYMPEMLPEAMRGLLVLNPFADLMAVIHALLQGLPMSSGNLLRPLVLWLLLLGPAWVLFRRTEPHMREAL